MHAPRKILYVSNLFYPYVVGGAEIVVDYLSSSISSFDYDVSIVSTIAKDRIKDGILAEDILDGRKIFRFNTNIYWVYEKNGHGLPQKMLWHFFDSWNMYVLSIFLKLLDNIKPDIVHTHNIDGFSPAVWAATKKRNIPLVHTAHDYHLICPRATLLKGNGELCRKPKYPCSVFSSWNIYHASKFIDLFCSPSQFLLDKHLKSGLTANKHKVIYNGIPSASPSKGQLDKPSLKSKINILYIGQLSKHKGIQNLIDAYRILENPDVVDLNIAGKGPLQSYVEEFARQNEGVVYHGFVSGTQKEELLTKADVLILPSLWYENAPLSLLEAFINSTAVIASDLGGTKELVNDGYNGFIYEANDVRALADYIQLLSDNKELLISMKENAQISGEKYSSHSMAKNYHFEYLKLIEKVNINQVQYSD